MSTKITEPVWKYCHYTGTKKLVLLALADRADKAGICWPSTRDVAERVNTTERRVQQIMRELIAEGAVVIVEPPDGRRRTPTYRVACQRFAPRDFAEPEKEYRSSEIPERCQRNFRQRNKEWEP
jgi:Helix-turn-helix domain